MQKLLQLFLSINRRWWASLLALVILTTCIVIGAQEGRFERRYYSTLLIELNDGWYTEDGIEMQLNSLPYGEIVLTHATEGLALSNKRLCTRSVDTFFEVLADGELVYSYFPEQAAILGASYGMYIHAIPIPETTRMLTIRLTPIFEDGQPTLLGTTIEDPGMFMADLFKEGIPGFCMCLMMLILGIIMVIIGIFSSGRGDHQQLEFLTLGMFAVLTAAWSVNDTLILQMLTQNPALIRLMNYMTLIFLPYFVVSFIAYATNHQKSQLLPTLFTVVCLNFLVNLLFTVTKRSDYYNMVKLSQVVIVFSLVIAAYFVITAVHRNQVEKRFLLTFLAGISALGLGTAVDLIRFRMTTGVLQVTSLYARIGSLFFLVMIGLHLILENNRLQRETSQALARLAFVDGLTGLKNRLAFNKAEEALQVEPDAKCIIMQFDINDLKKVNDVYGHAEGDRHICGAAHIIRDCTQAAGDCYRTGGDEFITIFQGTDDETAAQHCITQMEQLVQAYNEQEKPPVLMDIAYGMASYRSEEGSLEQAEQLADQRMYECKRIKKSGGEAQSKDQNCAV